jgi:hypothetical protein
MNRNVRMNVHGVETPLNIGKPGQQECKRIECSDRHDIGIDIRVD